MKHFVRATPRRVSRGFLGELAALNVLRPDLAEQVRSGALPAGDGGADVWRAAVQDAYLEQLLQKPEA